MTLYVQTTFQRKHVASHMFLGTIESLRNKLSLSTSLSFTEVAAPVAAIQTPDRCYKGIHDLL